MSITDGKTPDPSDVDSIHSVMYNAPSNSCYVFNCQQGKGRTTVGMVLAVLFLSALVRLCPTIQSRSGRAHRTRYVVSVIRSFASRINASQACEVIVMSDASSVQDRHSEGTLRINPERQFVSATLREGADVSGARPILPSALSCNSTEDEHASASSPIDAFGTSPSFGPAHSYMSRRSRIGRVSSTGTSPDGHWGALARGTSTLASTTGASPLMGTVLSPRETRSAEAAEAHPPQYMGVRRLVRSLLNGPAVVPWLDSAVDACSHMVNLRTVIGQYRGQRVKRQRVRPEVSRLQQAFERDVVALCRYCLLLAYAAFLDRLPSTELGTASFSAWTSSMASVHVRLHPWIACGACSLARASLAEHVTRQRTIIEGGTQAVQHSHRHHSGRSHFTNCCLNTGCASGAAARPDACAHSACTLACAALRYAQPHGPHLCARRPDGAGARSHRADGAATPNLPHADAAHHPESTARLCPAAARPAERGRRGGRVGAAARHWAAHLAYQQPVSAGMPLLMQHTSTPLKFLRPRLL